jgi:RNA polymerase sigma-70 factor (ECF subfamily)
MDDATDKFDLALDGASAADVADESLARAALAGDEAAFEQLFERHRRRVGRIVGRFFNRPERIEEIVQEIFVKLYFALGDYSTERGPSFAAWLSRIAINSCYDQLRRARRRPESSITDITEDEVSHLRSRLRAGSYAADAESETISRDLANKLLARLSADDRLVLVLLEAEDMSVREIASHTGWTISKVKVRAHRARAALRRVLGDFI